MAGYNLSRMLSSINFYRCRFFFFFFSLDNKRLAVVKKLSYQCFDISNYREIGD